MNNEIKKWAVGLITMFCMFGMWACSNDDPQPNPGPNSDPTSDQDTLWREDLDTAIDIIAKAPAPCGLYYRGVNFHVNPRKDGIEVLNMGEASNYYLESDWYFEAQGRKYFLGDTIDIKGNRMPIRFICDLYTQKYVISACDIPPEVLEEGPIHYNFTFVWPSYGISKKVDVYAEQMPDYKQKREDLLNSLKSGEFERLNRFLVGYWVDGRTIVHEWPGSGGTYVVNL